MSIDTKKSNAKRSICRVERAESKTARKFTRFFGPDAIPDAFTINLDWLSFMCECYLPVPDPDVPALVFNDVVLEQKKTGTPMFLYGYNVYLGGEPVASLFTHPRNTKIMQPGTAKLEVLNHVLYSDSWMQVVSETCHAIGIEYIKNISRLDVAIDGANYIHAFINAYLRQGRRLTPELKSLGKWGDNQRVRMLGKANLDSKRFDRKTGLYNAFKIGSQRKCITIYNKSQEINQRSHKEYIREAWERAGMDVTADNWRVELRLTSESIKEIKGLKITDLASGRYLLELFKTQCKNFFDFVVFDNDSNVTRCKHIDLFQFNMLRVNLLEKIPRAVVAGAYKAKMAIHDAFRNIMLHRYRTEEAINTALDHITNTVNLYNLQRFYEKKKPEWIEAYQPLQI